MITIEKLMQKIKKRDFTLTEKEAIDLYLIYFGVENSLEFHWSRYGDSKNYLDTGGDLDLVIINGLNVGFKIVEKKR